MLITSELLERLTIAQLKHIHEMTTPDVQYQGIDAAMHSDDGYDYLKGALGLGHALLNANFDADLDALAKMLDPAHSEFVLETYASDGICNEIYAVLPTGWEAVWENRIDAGESALKDVKS